MIVSFRSKALERFWVKGEVRRVNARHVAKLTLILTTLDAAESPQGLNVSGWDFHGLVGDQSNRFAVKVDKNYRVTFGWSRSGPDAVDVDYEDYH